jgi:hypothetical protein
MDHRHFTKWAAETISVTPRSVEMRLRKNDIVVGDFHLDTQGRFSPMPPDGARRVLTDQAAAAWGKPVLALEWEEVDGWLTAELNGHLAKLGSVDLNKYEMQIDQNGHTVEIFGGPLFAQKTVEELLFKVGTLS